MDKNISIEIICPVCGKEALLKRTRRYDGFRRAGENLVCSSCGHVFANEEEVPFKTKQPSALFDKSELGSRPKVFKREEAMRLCRHCLHYVVNPFVQRCVRQHKEVEATDSCAHFTPRPSSGEKDQATR